MPKFQFVDPRSSEALSTLLPAMKRIGVDTEFIRERTFFPQLCLVQVAVGDGIYFADPMADARLSLFWDKLMDCHWVLHSARQDFEVIFHACGRLPTWVFDTQIAAALLGYAPQIGYAGLVRNLFDVELDKSHTRADWSQRPLPAAVLEYAAEDVEYLLPACDVLTERLQKLGRLSWANEDSAALLEPSLYESEVRRAIERLKGATNLTGQARAAAARLASWRESEAERADRPRQWIMKDSVLLEIASTRPRNRSALASIEGLSRSTLRRAGKQLLDMLAAARSDDVDYEPPRKPSERQKVILKEMQALVAASADELGIAAEVIAPRKELSAALNGDRQSRVFSGWRREIVGNRLLGMLEN